VITHPEKVLFPDDGITKGEVAAYYEAVAPVILSSHNQDIVYYGANRLYRSMDRGDTWQAISPELTTSKQRGDVPYATVTSVSESPSRFGLIWAGTDDGNLWVTRGDAGDWQRVDAGLPSDRWVSRVVGRTPQESLCFTVHAGGIVEWGGKPAQAYVIIPDSPAADDARAQGVHVYGMLRLDEAWETVMYGRHYVAVEHVWLRDCRGVLCAAVPAAGAYGCVGFPAATWLVTAGA
jgi:hypothetical protein